MTDYALAIEYLMGVAKYRCAENYDILKQTWEDERPIPSKSALDSAWINVYKNIKNDSINKIREERKYKDNIGYDGYIYNSDEASYRLIADAVNIYSNDGITELPQAWWDINNVDTLTTLSSLKGLANTIATRTQTVMVMARSAKTEITNANTIEEIDSIYNNYISQ